MEAAFIDRIAGRLQRLYGDAAPQVLPRLTALLDRCVVPSQGVGERWDQRDVVLITYADQIGSENDTPLGALRRFLLANGLDRCLNTVHLLPFFPYSSDDGFSVIDYRSVDPQCGSWNDIRRLGEGFDLMFDLVLNHVSQHSDWFQQYLQGREPYTRYFVEADPKQDLSAVTRPRSLPLLTAYETSRGLRWVWTTFSADQVDLNFAEPEVLLEMLGILLEFVSRGARIVRLDAIAYLWKQIGTSCIHLPPTHEVVKLMRDVLDAVAPRTILLTETNVPHAENVSYFGAGDEAHMVYQFSLPPLLLDAVLNQDAVPLRQWLAGLEAAPPGTTYFNFTASHDGIGVRPLEGLIPRERLERLIQACRDRGGLVSTRHNPDGNDSPYELNITYLDAVGDPGDPDPRRHAGRFLLTQAIMLALRGIPGVYFHSLVGTPNDLDGVRASGHARRINRRKYEIGELEEHLAYHGSLQQLVFAGYQSMLQTRRKQPAFHPDAAQQVWITEDPAVLAFVRTSRDQRQRILVAANLSEQPRQLDLPNDSGPHFARDLLSGRPLSGDRSLRLEGWEVVWATT